METFLLLMNSISDFWMSSSSMSTAMDIIFAILCGVGLFFLLIPFLKEYPGSPPPGSEKNISEVVKRRQSKTRKKTVTVEGCRDRQKNSLDIQTASQSMESPIQHPFLVSSPHPFWNSKEKLNQLSLPQLFSYLKVLEALIQQNFNQFLWGITSVLSESVVATAWVSRNSSSGERKTVRFRDACDLIHALPLDKEHAQVFLDKPLPHPFVTPSLVGMTGFQELKNLPSSIPNQTLSSFQSRSSRLSCATTEVGIQTSLPTVNELWQHKLNWKDAADCNIQNCQVAISQPTESSPRCTLPTKNTRSASILPEHYQMVHHHKESQHEEKEINVGAQQGAHFRFLPSMELTQLQGDSQPNSDGYCKNWPELNQPAQLSILNSKSCNYSQTVGSVLTGVPKKEALENSNILSTINESLGVEFLPCPSSSTPGEGLETKNPALRTDELLSINTTEDLSFLDPKTKMKLELNTMQLPMKRRRLSCVSRAEYFSKAATILEKMHHRDPGGIRVKTVSSARLQSSLLEHSPPQVQQTKRALPPTASHGYSRSDPDQWQRYQSVQPHALCFQPQLQQSRTIQGTGRYILPPNTSPEMSNVPWKKSEAVASGQLTWSATTVDIEDSVSPSWAKQTNTLMVKEPPHTWRVNLGSGEITNGQALNTSLEDFEPMETKRSQGHLQTPTPPNSEDVDLKTKEYSNNDLKANKQPQAWSVSPHPNEPNTVHPAMVSLPSQNSLPSLQNGWQDPENSQGLGDLLMSSNQSVETQEFRVHKDKTEAKNDNVFHPSEERSSILNPGDISQEERLGRISPSIPSFTQLNNTVKTESQSSSNIERKIKVSSQSSSKIISRYSSQHENLSTEFEGQGHSLNNEIPTPSTKQTQVVGRENLIYSTAVKLQSLINVLVQNLMNNLDDQSKLTREPVTQVQEYKMESLTFQLRGSPCSSKGSYDPKHSKPAGRMSGSHVCPKEHSHSFTFRRTEYKPQSGVDAQKVCHQRLNKLKRETGFDQHRTPLRNDNLYCCRGPGNKLSDQKAGDPGQMATKIGIGGSPHRSMVGHNHSARYTEIREKQEPGISHKALDPCENTKKSMSHGQLMRSKENHPVKDRKTGGQEQSIVAAQRNPGPDEIRTESGRECSPHRKPKIYNHSPRHREIMDKPQPGVNAQRAYDQQRRMAFDNLLNPNQNDQPCQHRVQSSLSDLKACDSDQSTRSGMDSCPHKSTNWHNLSFQYGGAGEKVLLHVNTQRTQDRHPDSVKRRDSDNLPTPERNDSPDGCRVIGERQQLGLADSITCEPGQMKMKSRKGSCPHRCPEGCKLLLRYEITGNKHQPGLVLKVCDPYQSSKEEIDHGQPVSSKVNHSAEHRRNGGQDQSDIAAQEASDLR
ncbi:spermatogenesis-associated protein 31A6-like [Rattus rattus]|uniref:spermatogenesis-associated protein 31A6-like n=1 Tax=Rattus rattus TaxID=10117 RepID=UPI0013F37663|nr:spermatogenesis-associated protein 31A6-like [Rattus rattus]